MNNDEFVMRARQLATLVLASSPSDVLALLRPGEILLAEVLPEEKRCAHESRMSGIIADIQRRAFSRKKGDGWNPCKATVIAWLREEAATIDDAIDPEERPASEGAHALLVAAHKMEHGDPGNPDCPWNKAPTPSTTHPSRTCRTCKHMFEPGAAYCRAPGFYAKLGKRIPRDRVDVGTPWWCPGWKAR